VAALRDRRAADEANIWKTLKVELASGKMPTPEEVLERLEACGKTPEELQEALELIERRRGFAATLKTAIEAEATVVECDEQLREIDARHEELLQQLRAEVAPIQARREIAERQARERGDAERRLRETATDPELLATLKQLEDLSSELGREGIELDDMIRREQQSLIDNRAIADRQSQGNIDALKRKIAEQEERINSRSERKDQIRQRQRELEQQRKSITERQLDPLAV
jgi:chromosome segregation ATPase